MPRTVCHFSCGAASAVATKIALKDAPDAMVVYCDTGSEHPDNQRFLKDCEQWFEKQITVLKSNEYKNVMDVVRRNKFFRNPQGAKCTQALKRLVWEKEWIPGDKEVFGYTNEEHRRVEKLKKNNPERVIITPLIEKHLSKSDCLAIVEKAGIELPKMYELGFQHNNCIGCVKSSSKDYWKMIRLNFPEVFQEFSSMERELGYALCRSVYLDELDDSPPKGDLQEISCGLFCQTEIEALC